MNIQSKNIKGMFVAGVFAVTSLVGAVALVQTPDVYAAGQTCTWTGAGVNNNFSTAANWSNCGSAAPTAGDIIRFDRQEALEADENLTNDLGVALGGIIVKKYDQGGGWASYIIDTLTFVDGAEISEELETASSFRGVSVFSGTVIGEGSLTYNGGLAYSNRQSIYTTYTVAGVLTATTGYGIYVSPSSSAQSLVLASPSVQIGGLGGGYCSGMQDFTYSSLTVQKGVSVNLASNYSKPITFGGGSGSVPQLQFCADYNESYQSVATTRAWTSPVTLLSDVSIYVDNDTTVNFTGTINGAGFAMTRNAASPGVLNNNPTSNNSNSETGTVENKVKETKLEGAVNESVTVVNKETAILTGTRTSVNVLKGGALKGTGIIQQWLSVNDGGTIAPGMSPGCLTAGALSLDGIFQVELGGTTACSGYDQIKVTGDDADYPDIYINENTTSLELYGFGSFVQQKGDVFVIIDNQGSKAIQGTFKGLPEGTEVKIGEAVFTISYKGGDGNDVVLTAQNSAKLPGVPNTGIAQVVMANPVVVLAASVLAVGAVLVATRKKAGAKA